ncbi:MAG: DUF4268 domain-containing protein [Bacteroidota bacterium]|nr:DUF4268 domain-containing protein [Bacteroidota bacterium]
MYSRSETAQLKQEFWIAFGKYLALHNNCEGNRINWVNYHTGHKHLYFRMEATQRNASISIQLSHEDSLMREMYYDRFLSFSKIISSVLQEEWNWELNRLDASGRNIAYIGIELNGVNVLDKSTWPEIISFLKPRMILLDEVWNDIKDAFEDLR